MNQDKIDPRVDLYDDYTHDRISRRQFLSRSAAITVGGVSALAMAQDSAAALRRSTDRLVHRPAHQGAVHGLPVTGRQFRRDARLPGAADRGGAVSSGPGDPREPRPQPLHRGCRAPRRGGGFLALAPDGLSPIGVTPATTTTAAPCSVPWISRSCART